MKTQSLLALAILGVGLISLLAAMAQNVDAGYRPKAGFVPDEKTAIKIAEAVLVPVFGDAQVNFERPFKARLLENEWAVEGSLPRPDGTNNIVGGVAEVRIDKESGCIKSLRHSK
jgi:NTF2 fold immunity protein